jgi:hypothetical protein
LIEECELNSLKICMKPSPDPDILLHFYINYPFFFDNSTFL